MFASSVWIIAKAGHDVDEQQPESLSYLLGQKLSQAGGLRWTVGTLVVR